MDKLKVIAIAVYESKTVRDAFKVLCGAVAAVVASNLGLL